NRLDWSIDVQVQENGTIAHGSHLRGRLEYHETNSGCAMRVDTGQTGPVQAPLLTQIIAVCRCREQAFLHRMTILMKELRDVVQDHTFTHRHDKHRGGYR